jgi:competence protein ComFC
LRPSSATPARGLGFGFESDRAPLRLEVLDCAAGRFDAVVPVPLHRSRLRRRGFNQAEVLARDVAAGLDAPVSDTLEAVRKTRDQVELTTGERRTNVEGAYAVWGRVRGRVLLVDDPFTTGATMSSCAETLLRGGAREVHAVSLCSTV